MDLGEKGIPDFLWGTWEYVRISTNVALHKDVWARWSHGGMSNTTPNEGVAWRGPAVAI